MFIDSVWEQDLIQLRRYLHQHPEVGFDLPNTRAFVKQKLLEYGITQIIEVGQYSLIASIENGDGPVIGLRADMDALPLQEENKHTYCSLTNGKMHACGHDAHTSMLLIAGRYLAKHRDLWKGTVKLLFQEAEEGPDPGGAYGIIQSKQVDDVECFFGLHVSPLHPSGLIALRPGEAMASADTIKIRLQGKGTHAAYPHLGVDLALLVSHLTLAFQELIARRISPVESTVITIAKISMGSAHNIIADSAVMEGTVRAFSNEMRTFIETEMRHLVNHFAAAYHATGDLDYVRTYDPTINTKAVAYMLEKIIKQSRGEEAFQFIEKPSMGAEDFSRYIFHRQGAIAWLGTKHQESTSYGLHHPKFDIDEAAMKYGVHAFTQFVIQYQREDFNDTH